MRLRALEMNGRKEVIDAGEYCGWALKEERVQDKRARHVGTKFTVCVCLP